MTEMDRLELALKELEDIQEDVPNQDHRDVIGWAAHYFRDALEELKKHRRSAVLDELMAESAKEM